MACSRLSVRSTLVIEKVCVQQDMQDMDFRRGCRSLLYSKSQNCVCGFIYIPQMLNPRTNCCTLSFGMSNLSLVNKRRSDVYCASGSTLTTTLPLAWLLMILSYALRVSSNSKTESTIGFKEPSSSILRMSSKSSSLCSTTISLQSRGAPPMIVGSLETHMSFAV